MVLTRRQAAAASNKDGDETSALSSAITDDPRGTEINSATGRAASRSGDSDSAEERAKKKKNIDFIHRLVTGLVLSGLLVAIILGGHIWVILAVIAMEVGMFREIIRLGQHATREDPLPLWSIIGWYFFGSVLYLFYGKAVLSHFENQSQPFMQWPILQNALRHHSFWSFLLYVIGFVGFVMSLRKDHYSEQFSYFGRTLVALVVVVVQSHFMILNVTQGLIWFILPCALIIVNDSFAYFCGRAFGKHSLTPLSPKKTWEGYLGGGFFTMISAFFLSELLSRFPSLVCPIYTFQECSFWTCPRLACDPLPLVFIHKTFEFTVPGLADPLSIVYRPVQLHAIALGLFASAIGPFGGFFASGVKRAFEIKDFANLFPGHGGVTDRVDCQLLMAVFTYVYVINFVQVNFVGSPDVGKVMSFVAELSVREQVELWHEILSRLQKRNVGEDLLNMTAICTGTKA